MPYFESELSTRVFPPAGDEDTVFLLCLRGEIILAALFMSIYFWSLGINGIA